ncbi:MAG: Dph6-related ATP pyrophosphatase [Candidatus Dormibacteria bacterium]
MSARCRTLLSWSSGKDSAFALAELRRDPDVDVVGLLTTINAVAERVAMHGVRRELLERQAEAVGLPLWTVPLPWPCPNEAYAAAMSDALLRARGEGITHMAFGDLFLADIRAYREDNLAGTGITPVFPLWGRDTGGLARQMVAAGQRAIVVCVDPAQLHRGWAGRQFDTRFLDELPAPCDPCGENGEFHTFAWDGPAFAHPVEVRAGEVVDRDGFTFADLLPLTAAAP